MYLRAPVCLVALLSRVPWEGHSVGPLWPGSVVLAGAVPMPPWWPADARHTPRPFRGRPHGRRPCAGHPSRLGAGAHPGTDTDPAPGGACPLVLCWLSPAGRLAHGGPVRQCPADVAWAGDVLPSRPSPWRGLAPPLSPRRDTTPQPSPAGLPCDRTAPLACPMCHRGASLPAWCRVRVSPAGPQELETIVQGLPRTGASGASHVLRRLSSCMPRPADSGGPAPPGHIGCAHVACGRVKTLGVRHGHVEAVPARQGARSPLRPPGCSGDASPLLFAVIPHDSAMDARRATGGWLPLTRQGLSPCKRRQACLAR